MNDRRRSLYLCYLSLEDPLTHTQVVAYLEGLASAGHRIHLLTFEPGRLTRRRRSGYRNELEAKGIRWHGLRYHKRPSLPATIVDAFAGALLATALVLRYRLDTVHARAHVPAAMTLIARLLLGSRAPKLIFDIRGLMAEEYEDAGRWKRNSIPFRLTKSVERRAIRDAAAVVVLTERIRWSLFGEHPPAPTYVIPCCCDLDAIASQRGRRDAVRKELGLETATVMIYVGKFGGWYMTAEMADFFSTSLESLPSLHFLVLTQGDGKAIEMELNMRGVRGSYTISSVLPEDLGAYLAAADFGICFIRPAPSKASSSPTKVGEYLGAGLPVVYTAGVGDLDAMLHDNVSVRVHDHTEPAYHAAGRKLKTLLGRPEANLEARELAERRLSLARVGIPAYRAVYRELCVDSRG